MFKDVDTFRACCFFLGHRYGSTLVPFSADDKEAMKYRAEKCFKVLGFTKSENVSTQL